MIRDTHVERRRAGRILGEASGPRQGGCKLLIPPSWSASGAIARTGDGAGLRPETPPGGAASWNSAKGSGPWNPLMGLFSGEGQPRPCKVRVGPPLRTNPIDRSQRASPFAGDPRGKAPGGFQGGALTLQPARTIAPTRSP